MTHPIGPDTSREELASLVAQTLHAHAIDAVLVGGSVVAIYSKGRYVTADLDFVSYKPLKTVRPVMETLGFKMTGNMAVHPATTLYVQFCSPPLSVGREPVRSVVLNTAHGPIETLSPTDCVLDRLMQFYHWNDEQALEQALLVARSQRKALDVDKVRRVSEHEGKREAFAEFERRFAQRLR